MTKEEIEIRISSKFNPFIWEGKVRRLRRFNRSYYSLNILWFILVMTTLVILNLGLSNQFGIVRHKDLPLLQILFLIRLLIFIFSVIFFLIIPSIGRLRDLNASPFWIIFLLFLPFLFIIVLMIIKGTNGPNKYGPPTLGYTEARTIKNREKYNTVT